MKEVKKGRHVPKYGNRKLVYGKGLLDIDFSCKIDAITAKAYKIYGAILGKPCL